MSLLSSLTTIRYFTASDPYFYTIDNRPVTDLETSTVTIANYIDGIYDGATGTFTASIVNKTSADLTLKTTTSGNVVLSPATDIKWGKALVALGGGAAPTLGTIGGSGPASAAQNSWMRVLDSTGAAFWVPAWK